LISHAKLARLQATNRLLQTLRTVCIIFAKRGADRLLFDFQTPLGRTNEYQRVSQPARQRTSDATLLTHSKLAVRHSTPSLNICREDTELARLDLTQLCGAE